MPTRRHFIQAVAVTLPLAGCGRNVQPQEPAIGNLSPEQMENVHKERAQFENALNAVRKADVPYAIAPRFYPAV
ncbi:MAG TPA: hypothetical protein VER98_17355 [Terriglobia bacterium]|nr:hypothetical protein [Terriglobia bacterium]